ncbi:hypothetical protein [Spiroplasma sp. Moj]|uniref:hypothetical protein n=1 Tax=Spiroplasma sp. Moj TaxID=1922342 RepID=UPI0039F1319E
MNKKDHATPYIMERVAYQNKRKYEKQKISRRIVFDCDHVRGIYHNSTEYLIAIVNFITTAKRK